MTNKSTGEQVQIPRLPNGAGAAALLSAGLGAFILAVLAIIADHSLAFKKVMIFYTPTGPLSGVTTTAIAVWLVCWIGLDLAWRRRDVRHWPVAAGLCLIAISFVLMFPPVGDLF
jgi:hypothetical protein